MSPRCHYSTFSAVCQAPSLRDPKRPRGTAFPPAGGGGGRNPAARVFGSKVRYVGNGGRGGETERRECPPQCAGRGEPPARPARSRGRAGAKQQHARGIPEAKEHRHPRRQTEEHPPPLPTSPPPPTACEGGAGGGASRGARGTGAAKRGSQWGSPSAGQSPKRLPITLTAELFEHGTHKDPRGGNCATTPILRGGTPCSFGGTCKRSGVGLLAAKLRKMCVLRVRFARKTFVFLRTSIPLAGVRESSQAHNAERPADMAKTRSPAGGARGDTRGGRGKALRTATAAQDRRGEGEGAR